MLDCESMFVSRSSRKASGQDSIRWVDPGLVGDHGQVLRLLGWALTRIRNLSLVLSCIAVHKRCQQRLYVNQTRELQVYRCHRRELLPVTDA